MIARADQPPLYSAGDCTTIAPEANDTRLGSGSAFAGFFTTAVTGAACGAVAC